MQSVLGPRQLIGLNVHSRGGNILLEDHAARRIIGNVHALKAAVHIGDVVGLGLGLACVKIVGVNWREGGRGRALREGSLGTCCEVTSHSVDLAARDVERKGVINR